MASYRLRLDPWTAEFEGPVQLGDEDPAGRVDLVGRDGGLGRRPAAAGAPCPGAPRSWTACAAWSCGCLIEDGARTIFGLLGSFGVGAVEVGERAAVGHDDDRALAIAGGGLALEPVEVAVGGRAPALRARRASPRTRRWRRSTACRRAMRRSEAALAERLAPERDVVFLDGPLSYVTQALRSARRLREAAAPELPRARGRVPAPRRLEVGERTPVFLIEGARAARYSWYLRLGWGRPIDTPLAGVVRLETLGRPRPRARDAPSPTSPRATLPRFASDPARDPRAPQNLYPIGGLEARLRHLLGDPPLLRRAIEEHVHDEVTA